jgi:hypothetical protein
MWVSGDFTAIWRLKLYAFLDITANPRGLMPYVVIYAHIRLKPYVGDKIWYMSKLQQLITES